MTAVRAPHVPFDRALGAGFDLRYGDDHGFVRAGRDDRRAGDVISDRVRRFLSDHQRRLGYALLSFQPRDRGLLDTADYFPIWDQLFTDLPALPAFALHHTQLNLGTIDRRVDRGRLLAFTNALIERYDLRWVNEDVGIWSIDGKPMPYPLPPVFTDHGLDAAARHTDDVQRALAAPLVLEFPGFDDGAPVIGDVDAYDWFRGLAERTASPVTLDTGHLLSYRWRLGCRGAELYDELDRLPLAHCFEIHLSGCRIAGDRFVDAHHGVLLTEQLELLSRLLAACPAVRAVTYEDPKLSPDGELIAGARAPFARLERIAADWGARGGGHADPRAA